mgnify:CR=1 FL=1|tara:strand:- start:265 stop:489 length:225 start_codon:yes stop_codon:yes gene_type:complete
MNDEEIFKDPFEIDAPVIIATWSIERGPNVIIWEAGWDLLDNDDRIELMQNLADVMLELQEHLVPDYPPEDLQA